MGYAKQYILAHDLGTSGNKATLYDIRGTLCASTVCGYATYYPHDQWVEQNPEDWWAAVCRSTQQLLEQAGVAPGQVLCVSFSAQMMGCLLVDSRGKPLRPMMIWADSRSGAQEKEMIRRVGAQEGYRITGHRLSASYSAAKLLWIQQNEPEIYQKAAKMLNAKDYIVYRLTGQMMTDYSDASGTNLLDITAKKWSDSLVTALGIRKDLLPELHRSADIAGGITAEAAGQIGLLAGTPVVIGGGDGSCACVGAGVVAEGTAYNVIGSSSWISLASRRPLFDPQMRTFNWVHLDETLYTPCATMQAAGYSYSWYRDVLGTPEVQRAREMGVSPYLLLDEQAAQSPPGAKGLLYLPYLLGERAPLWNLDARACFVGMKISTGKGDMTRAVLEGVGYHLRMILDILQGSFALEGLVMTGGGAKGRLWLQILADIWQKKLLLPRYIEEATSLGAAVCAGVGVGLYPDYQAARHMNPIVEEILPDPAKAALYDRLYEAFGQAYQALVPVFDHLAAICREEEGHG
ncbi:MAG: xylulokinase [Eubacteriales bacterium]|nr:xylulokinase [Eubacteriales bacterium]